jgi:diguanylate cyclase (GGDEF)-like protein
MGQAAAGVTISLGVAWMNPDRMSPLDGLINCADQAMYSAKRQGRNRVVAWTENEKSMEMGEMDKPS